MAYAGAAVHIGCAFSIIELVAVLYRNHLKFPSNDPESPARDYFVLSKGHGVMAQYACFRQLGWLDQGAIDNYFSNASALKGLSDSRIKGCEVTSGSLGHGFSVGVGLALGAKIKGTHQRTFVLVGDGEMNEGAIWEGALFAAHHKLRNFILIIDQNGYQAMGKTEEILELGSFSEKLYSFGFEVLTVNGHDENEIDQAITNLCSSNSDRPKAIIAQTVKGKGVSFMEHDNKWHYTRLTTESYREALMALGQDLV